MSVRYYAIVMIVASLCLVQSSALSQIPNGGFESWTGGEPDGWVTSNINGLVTNVTQSAVAHSGTSAVRGDVVQLFTQVLQPVLQVGPGARGFAYNVRAGSFTGWYQFTPVGGDRFAINVILTRGGISGIGVAFAAAALPAQVTSYTQVTVPFLYQDPGPVDTCEVQFQIIGPSVGVPPHVGSFFILDDIALTGSAAVEPGPETVPLTTSLEQNYPNPFNPTTTIRYQLAGASVVTLKVFNVLGREVATLVQGMNQAGPHTAVWDARTQPSGVYYCRLEAGAFSETRKLILTK